MTRHYGKLYGFCDLVRREGYLAIICQFESPFVRRVSPKHSFFFALDDATYRSGPVE